MKNIDHIIFIKTNEKLKNSLDQIIDFQIKRIKNFSKNIYILDEDKILHNKKFDSIRLTNSKKIKKIVELNKLANFIIIESINPMLDIELLHNLKKIKFTDVLKIEGAIPGTSPKFVISSKKLNKILCKNNWLNNLKHTETYFWETQNFENNQFDLNNPIRLKIFLKLKSKISNLENLSIKEFIKNLNTSKIFNLILDYGEDNIETKTVNFCPHCNSKLLKPLYFRTNQPIIGFLSNKKFVYLECQNCGLVFLKNQCLMQNLHLLYDEFGRPKINVKIGIENLVKNKSGTHLEEKNISLQLLKKYASKKSKMIDLGAGFGEFACMIKNKNPNWDVHCVDFNLDHVKSFLEKKKVISHNQNFLEENFGENFDIISIMHVIEHIPVIELEKFFTKIYNSLNKDGLLLITTPNYESPLAKIFDYHMAYPPQHQTILSVKWIEKFFKDLNYFKIIKISSASVIFEHYEEWFGYYKNTAPNDELKGVVNLFDIIYNNKKLFESLHNKINKNNLGSESIIILKKI